MEIILITLLFSVLFAVCFALQGPSHHSRKSHKSHKKIRASQHHHKNANAKLYGVSLSSITGFEKPMLPPKIINYDLPVNYNEPPSMADLDLIMDLPSKIDLFATNATGSIIHFNPNSNKNNNNNINDNSSSSNNDSKNRITKHNHHNHAQ